jgi:hypothetical protein
METYSKQFQELLDETRVAIDNTGTHDVIKTRVVNRGYDDAAMQAANNLRTKTNNKYRDYQLKRADQIEATSKVKAKLFMEISRYMDLRQGAKIALRGDQYKGFREMLGIDDKRRQTYAGFLDQGGKFYENAMGNDEIKALLATVGITEEKLQEGVDGIEELILLNDDQEAKKGLSQAARKERDDLYKELRQWWTDFKSSCRREFKDNPQYLEILGIKAFSEGYVRKKKEKEPTAQEPQELQEPQAN